MKNFKTMKKVLLFALILIFLKTANVNAQVTIGAEAEPDEFSLLDIVTTNIKKGLHMPRLTTAERDALTSREKNITKGLVIYNTDADCQEYWNGMEWISLCQAFSNPVVEIPASACGKIRVFGQYHKSAPLSSSHYVTIPVTVTQKGNYTIIASSGNGYYFQASGVFESTGDFEINLVGMGTPAKNGTDNLVFTCNGTTIGTTCNVSVTVGVQTMSYRADNLITVFGSYQTRRFMDKLNFVVVPIDVLVTGTTTFETNFVNGIKFSVNQVLTKLGTDLLILYAQGSPQKAGKYQFTFTTDGGIKNTGSFEVLFTSTLGTFADPACKCLDIYNERPDVSNGEYWLQDCLDAAETTPVKTYCDIKNGGWTLVWSFSENTARNTYTPSGSMEVSGAIYSAFNDIPINRVTVENGTINYANYRLNRNEWRNFPNSTSRPQLKVRITEDPTDMDDQWALNNYGIVAPRNINENPIENNFSQFRPRVPAYGKIFGKNWKVDPAISSAYGGWDEVTGNRTELVLYNSTRYCTHWNFGSVGSATQFQVSPNKGGANNTIAMNQNNNAFGWFGEIQANHHFGKCTARGDDYNFATKTCATAALFPHSFNNGQGRYLQWFVR
jgi:hypothetical protein